MELRHLKYIVAVAEELHFGRAAKRLNISQPPLSQQIMQLEEELGVKLLDRNKRHVRLTEAGRVFVNGARMTLAQADNAKKLAAQAGRGEIGHLTLGMSSAVDPRFIVEILRAFTQRYPQVRLVLRNLDSAAQVEALRTGQIDAGFLIEPVSDPALTVETIQHERVVVALPDNHPLASRTSLTMRDIAAQPYVMFSRSVSPAYYDGIVAFCRNSGFSLNIVHESDNIHTTLMLVAAGLGISLLPSFTEREEGMHISFKKIRGPAPERIVGKAYRRDNPGKIVLSLCEVIREVVAARNAPLKRVAR